MNAKKEKVNKPILDLKGHSPALDSQLVINRASGEGYVERRKLLAVRLHINRIVKKRLSLEELQIELEKLRIELGKHYKRAYHAALKYQRQK